MHEGWRFLAWAVKRSRLIGDYSTLMSSSHPLILLYGIALATEFYARSPYCCCCCHRRLLGALAAAAAGGCKAAAKLLQSSCNGNAATTAPPPHTTSPLPQNQTTDTIVVIICIVCICTCTSTRIASASDCFLSCSCVLLRHGIRHGEARNGGLSPPFYNQHRHPSLSLSYYGVFLVLTWLVQLLVGRRHLDMSWIWRPKLA